MSRCYSFSGTEKHGQFYVKLPIGSKIKHTKMTDCLLEEKKLPCELILTPFKKESAPVVWHDYMYNFVGLEFIKYTEKRPAR